MKIFIKLIWIGWLLAGSVPGFTQDVPFGDEPPMPEEFSSIMVVDNLFSHEIAVESHLNLGTFTVREYKSGNNLDNRAVMIPDSFTIRPVTITTGWYEAASLIRWFTRFQKDKQEKHDIQMYVRHRDSQKNHLHITLYQCWPSEIKLNPFVGYLPSVSVTFQVESIKCHLPEMLKLMN